MVMQVVKHRLDIYRRNINTSQSVNKPMQYYGIYVYRYIYCIIICLFYYHLKQIDCRSFSQIIKVYRHYHYYLKRRVQ